MVEFHTGYQSLDTEDESSTEQRLLNEDEAPVHVHTHELNGRAQWNHIENLDDFFSRIYQFHQRNGFLCMVVEDVMQLGQFLFVVLFTGFLIDCVNYDILFATDHKYVKHTFSDVITTPCKCGFSDPAVSICMIIAFVFLGMRTIKVLYNVFRYWEIHRFYQLALKINSGELSNKTWHEVQHLLMEAQKELQMCIHKVELTQLDIYHRILRFKNYFIALVNKSILPLKFTPPLIGERCYLSNGLKFNLEMILFWGPFAISPFENAWHLRPEYRNVHRRIELSTQLSKTILIVGVMNLILSPFIFVWQILYLFFVYGETVKREPSFLGSRKWSLYGRTYLRHFNELDHELNSRLKRGYDVSNDYLNGFTSPLFTIMAKSVAFFAGAILVVLVCLSVYDEDTLHIEHMITLITGCGVVLTACRVFIPPENTVFCPETLMVRILGFTHYQPDHWKNYAHTSRVQHEFSQLFQLKAIFLLDELISPLITPFILIFYLRPRSLEIVDFFRNFTVEVLGVGDVCSFAQLDIRKHGNPKWAPPNATNADSYQQAENGKTELSLMHFALTNPTWQPPAGGNQFLTSIREQAVRDADSAALERTALTDSIQSLVQPNYPNIMSISGAPTCSSGLLGRTVTRSVTSQHDGMRRRKLYGALSQHSGPLSEETQNLGVLSALSHSGSEGGLPQELQHLVDPSSLEYNVNEMSLSVVYMHELRRRNELPAIGYENLEEVRQVMTDSQLTPEHELHSINDETSTTSLTHSYSDRTSV